MCNGLVPSVLLTMACIPHVLSSTTDTYYGGPAVIKELNEHFSFDENRIRSVSSLLQRMKELAHKQTYGGREFSRDVRVPT